MSKSGTINFRFNAVPSNIEIARLISWFEIYGWNIEFAGQISYLPYQDQLFEWVFEPIEKRESIISIIKRKYNEHELVGLILYWEDTEIGVNFLFYAGLQEISCSIDINRKEIYNLGISDFTWYLERLVPVFIEARFSIEVIECVDS